MVDESVVEGVVEIDTGGEMCWVYVCMFVSVHLEKEARNSFPVEWYARFRACEYAPEEIQWLIPTP